MLHSFAWDKYDWFKPIDWFNQYFIGERHKQYVVDTLHQSCHKNSYILYTNGMLAGRNITYFIYPKSYSESIFKFYGVWGLSAL